MTHKEKELTLNVGDVVVIKGDERNRAHWKTGIVENLIRGKDGVVRGARLIAGKDRLERAVDHLYPLELTCDASRISKQTLDPAADVFRPRRNASAIARILTHDQLENENTIATVEHQICYYSYQIGGACGTLDIVHMIEETAEDTFHTSRLTEDGILILVQPECLNSRVQPI